MFRKQRGEQRSGRPGGEVKSMSTKASTGLVLFGSLFMLLGLCFLPEALLDRKDASTLEMGLCLFSAGSLIASLGMYFKARLLRGGILPERAAPETAAKRKLRGGCDLCGIEAPVIRCTVHQIEVCGLCLVQHYDQRSCAYVPSKRAAKNGKGLAKAKGA